MRASSKVFCSAGVPFGSPDRSARGAACRRAGPLRARVRRLRSGPRLPRLGLGRRAAPPAPSRRPGSAAAGALAACAGRPGSSRPRPCRRPAPPARPSAWRRTSAARALKIAATSSSFGSSSSFCSTRGDLLELVAVDRLRHRHAGLLHRQPHHRNHVGDDQDDVLRHLGPGDRPHAAEERAHQNAAQADEDADLERERRRAAR